ELRSRAKERPTDQPELLERAADFIDWVPSGYVPRAPAGAADALEKMRQEIMQWKYECREGCERAEQAENDLKLAKASNESLGADLLKVQKDCIRERQRARNAEADLASLKRDFWRCDRERIEARARAEKVETPRAAILAADE